MGNCWVNNEVTNIEHNFERKNEDIVINKIKASESHNKSSLQSIKNTINIEKSNSSPKKLGISQDLNDNNSRHCSIKMGTNNDDAVSLDLRNNSQLTVEDMRSRIIGNATQVS